MLKSLPGGGRVEVDPLPHPTKVTTHNEIQTPAKALARVAGDRYTRVVRVPNLQEKQHPKGHRVNPLIPIRCTIKYNSHKKISSIDLIGTDLDRFPSDLGG
jgi:hypothetical protein